MSSTEIILSQETRADLRKFSDEQFKTRTLASEISNENVAYAVACIGAELGLSPLQSLRGIYMVKGKPILAAQTIQAIVVRHRDVCEYLMLVESSREKATYETKRVGDPRPTTLSYTIEDAKIAGLLGNGVWKHAAAMLRNRCVAAICRAVYPDLAMGLYEEDEGREIAQGRVIEAAPVPQPATQPEPTPEPTPTTEKLHPAFSPEPGDELRAAITFAADITALKAIGARIAAEVPADSELRAELRTLYTQRTELLKP